MTSEPGPHVSLYRVAGRPIVVCDPAVHAYGHTVIELIHGLAFARREDAEVAIIRNPRVVNPALYEIELDDRRIIRRGPLRAAVLARHWARRHRPRLDQFRGELALELKERSREDGLPRAVSKRLTRVREGLARKLETGNVDSGSYFRRDLVLPPVGARLRSAVERVAREQAARLGLAPDAPVVCIHVRESGFKGGREQEDKGSTRADAVRNASLENHLPACDRLVAQGYTVVRLGDPTMTPLRRKGYVDLATSPGRSGFLELHVVQRADLFISGDSGPNVLGLLMDTPILYVNVTDPISCYPVRPDGHVLFKRIVDRKTGESLRLTELFGERYFRNLRDPQHFRFEENTADEITAAVDEALAWIRGERQETPRQAAFREYAARTSVRLRDDFSYARKWGPHDGFLGSGRVIDIQLGDA